MFGFSQGLSLWDKSKHQTAHWQSLEYRHGLLSRLFIRAQAATYQRINDIYVPFFQGSAQKITFMSRDPILDFSGRTTAIKLTILKNDNNSYQLKYHQGLRYADPARGIRWQEKDTVLIDNLKEGRFHFEAAAFPLPEELDPNYLDANDKQRYREVAEWVEQFNGEVMWHMPKKVAFWFVDENAVEHRWFFPLSQQSDAWSLDVYHDD